MEKIKVVVFGTLPLATKICELLLEHPKFDLYAVVLGKSNPVNINIFDNTKCPKILHLKKIKSISIEELSQILLQIFLIMASHVDMIKF